MEIKPELMNRLLSEDDHTLWETIRRIAAMNNVALPEKCPSDKSMEAIKSMLKSGSMRYEDAVAILERYRKGSIS